LGLLERYPLVLLYILGLHLNVTKIRLHLKELGKNFVASGLKISFIHLKKRVYWIKFQNTLETINHSRIDIKWNKQETFLTMNS